MSKTGRNDPCLCGSGKKYKKCCLQKGFVQTGREESIKQRMNQELLRLFRLDLYEKSMADAIDEFWDGFDPREYLNDNEMQAAEINFWEWVVHDWRDQDSGKLLVDIYIERTDVLSLDDRVVLDKIRHSNLSLFEVQEVFLQKGMLLKDLLLGEEYDVREKAATEHLRKWDIFATRLLQLDGQYIMSGAFYPFPIKYKSILIDDIMQEFEADKNEVTAGELDLFLKENGDVFNFHWTELIRNPVKPQLANTDGELLVISKAFYQVKDKNAVMKSLRSVKGLDEHEGNERFDWLGKRSKEGQTTILGSICFEKKHMVLEVNSRERLNKGKALIKKHVPDAVHQVDTFEDIDKYLASMKDKPSPEPSEDIPFEVQQEMYTQFMDSHMKKWLKEKIPALGGKSPRQAKMSKTGKQQVIELLKFMENTEEKNRRDGRPSYDIDWVWGELGIEREK
jgi:hypothetical protein